MSYHDIIPRGLFGSPFMAHQESGMYRQQYEATMRRPQFDSESAFRAPSRCEYCRTIRKEDSRGLCRSCGAPQEPK